MSSEIEVKAATPSPPLKIVEPIVLSAPPLKVLSPKVAATAGALDKFKNWLDRNHNGSILDELEQMGRFSLWVLRLAAKLIPDKTIIGKYADKGQALVEDVQDALKGDPKP